MTKKTHPKKIGAPSNYHAKKDSDSYDLDSIERKQNSNAKNPSNNNSSNNSSNITKKDIKKTIEKLYAPKNKGKKKNRDRLKSRAIIENEMEWANKKKKEIKFFIF